jgi:hypothetical protein
MQLDNCQERKYMQIFEDTCRFVASQKLHNPNFSIEDLEGLLHSACIREGNNWVGRGASADIANSATIAAYERMLAEWRAEQG